MRTVKSRKGLLKAFEDGEKRVMVEEGSLLYYGCLVAYKFSNLKLLVKEHLVDLKERILGKSAGLSDSSVLLIMVLSIALLVTTISIIAILKRKNLKLKFEGFGISGQMEVYDPSPDISS